MADLGLVFSLSSLLERLSSRTATTRREVYQQIAQEIDLWCDLAVSMIDSNTALDPDTEEAVYSACRNLERRWVSIRNSNAAKYLTDNEFQELFELWHDYADAPGGWQANLFLGRSDLREKRARRNLQDQVMRFRDYSTRLKLNKF